MFGGKIKFFAIAAFLFAALFGTTYSSWSYNANATANNIAQVEIPEWIFGDPGFAKIENVRNCSYLTATKEETIVKGSTEAVRLTNTAGTQTKQHSFIVDFDRDYTLGEVATFTIEFDYYHAQKREQSGKGFPVVQLMYNNSNLGSTQGGGETVNEKSPFVVTNLDDNWWHLEYFITAHCPTMADHQDTPIGTNKKLNCIKITDNYVYDYGSTTAFIVIDNMVFDAKPTSRLGIFNRTTSQAVGTFYWFKVAWAGELHSCVITTSDPTIAVQDTASTKSPFYVELLKKGTVTITATLEIGDAHTILSISNTLTAT